MKDFKTTLCGVLTIGAGIALIYLGISAPVGAALIPVGAGLIMASDSKSTPPPAAQ